MTNEDNVGIAILQEINKVELVITCEIDPINGFQCRLKQVSPIIETEVDEN